MDKKTAQKRILLVDDNPDMLMVLSDILKNAGYVVKKTRSAQGAMKIVEQKFPDLVLIDLRMPKTDGIQLMHSIKKKNPEILVIIYSGYPSIGTAVEALKDGADDYISKPFKLNELRTRVSKVLNKDKK